MLRRCHLPRGSSWSRAVSSTWRRPVLTDRAVVLEGDRIRDVVPASDAPQERTIDLSGRTVLPGMIDCHAHLIGEMDDGQGYAYLVNRCPPRRPSPG